MMNIITGTKLCGFTAQRIRDVEEIGGKLIEMVHDKTGAKLCWMNNGDQNKLFCVGFKTIPEDSTGVFHILEHSVLCGSEKYPVKEPFVDLLRSSMNTFLNAMTYPDKTVYPVSSRNEQDFLNLTSVYLDAVFAPALIKNPNVFYQEGIHTELGEDDPSYKGVVFNEMKGALSSVNDKIEYEFNKLLFPNNCYKYNSGGDPAVIPDLTYEQYVKTYKKFYHPSNALFFLDGDIPLEKTLDMINTYLEKYDKCPLDVDVEYQVPTALEDTSYYEIDSNESTDGKSILVLGKIISTWENKTKITAANILCDMLADSNESPLKRAILSAGLAEDVEMAVMDCISQPYLLLIIRNMKESNSSKVRALIKDTVAGLLKDGLDKQNIYASINRFAFGVKQISEPQGLYRALSSYNSWLYGGDPLQYLVYDETIEDLRKMAESGGFELLLEELMNDKKFSALQMIASHTIALQERNTENNRVKREVSALSSEQKEDLVMLNEKLVKWQQTPDSPEAAATLPTLELSSVGTAPENVKTTVTTENGVTVLHHQIQTHGIVYLTMYFPLTRFSLEQLTALSLYPSLMGELPTKNRSVAKLQQDIKTYIGSLRFSINAVAKIDQSDKCTPYFVARAGILEENLDAAKEIILDILLNTQLDNAEKIEEIVLQNDEMSRQEAVGSGHLLGLLAVRSHYTAKEAVNEALKGYTSLHYLHNFAKNFDKTIGSFIELGKQLQGEALCRDGLTVSVTASEAISVFDMLNKLPQGKASEADREYKTNLPKKMGIKIPAKISFAVKGYNLGCCGEKTEGSLKVASNIVSLSYLWNSVRVQGGAYGTGFMAGNDGTVACYSYRDPSPSRSLAVYDDIGDFIGEFCRSDENLDKYIIAAVAATEPLRSPLEQGIVADDYYFSGFTDDVRLEIRKQMLATDREALNRWCGVIDKMASDGAVCVVGNEEALKDCDDLTVCDVLSNS